MPTREEMWSRLGGEYDVLVIGGGINGAGIARDAALRGLRVALVEMRDLAFGTSSRSSKLVHGGLRYLEQFELGLVFESVNERGLLMQFAPHLVRPLGFVFPVYRSGRVPLWKMRAGVWLYHLLCLRRTPGRWRLLRPPDVAREEPALQREQLDGAPLYYDCSTDDARLTLESALDAAGAGATVATYARVTALVRDGARVVGAVVRDEIGGREQIVRAGVVVNATGPWTDRLLAMSEGNHPMLRPTKGTHIVVRRSVLPVEHAVVCIHPDDGRVLFAIPWGDETYLGTTDTDFDGDPADVFATADDVRYIIDAAARYFPDHPIGANDVISTWAGLRPLVSGEQAAGLSESSVSREHTVQVGQDGLVTVAGGKLTTYRKMAAEVVEHALRELRRRELLPPGPHRHPELRRPLPGAVDWPAGGADAIRAELRALAPTLRDETVALLAATYGVCARDVAGLVVADPALAQPLVPGRPEILAQVDYGVQVELAATVTDLLKQRTQLYYRDADQGLGAVDAVAVRLQQLVGYDDATRDRLADDYRAEVAASRRWRTEAVSDASSAA